MSAPVDDRDEQDDATAQAEALAKARELIAQISAEMVPLLDQLGPVGRGDGDAHLPNSIRLLTFFCDAIDARDVLMANAAVAERSLRRIAAGVPTPRAAKEVIAAIVRAFASQARANGQPPSAVESIEREVGPALEAAAARWDALAQTVGDSVSPQHAASIVLRVVAVDVGIRLGVLRRVATVEHGAWFVFEPRPLGYAIDAIVLPSLALTIGDVHEENPDGRGAHHWARSTLARWRLENAIPEPSQLDDFARDVVALARQRRKGPPVAANAVETVSRVLRTARGAVVVRRAISDAFPAGVGERLVSDFVTAVKMVEADAFEVFTEDGLLIAYCLAHMFSPSSEVALVDGNGKADESVVEGFARAGLTRDHAVHLSRLMTMQRLMKGDAITRARVRAITVQSLLVCGSTAAEAIVMRERLANRLPESPLRTCVERLGRDPRRTIFGQVLLVGFLETIAEGAGDDGLSESLRRTAARWAAILPEDEGRS